MSEWKINLTLRFKTKNTEELGNTLWLGKKLNYVIKELFLWAVLSLAYFPDTQLLLRGPISFCYVHYRGS